MDLFLHHPLRNCPGMVRMGAEPLPAPLPAAPASLNSTHWIASAKTNGSASGGC